MRCRDFQQKIPLKRAVTIILLSVIFIWGSLFIAWIIHERVLEKRKHNNDFQITGIFQKSRSEPLPKRMLPELLGLSCDQKTNLYAFDVGLAEETLKRIPIFSEVHIKKIRPCFLYIDYEMRTPEFIVGDFENRAIDRSGVLFGLYPFYSEKRLPCVFFGGKIEERLRVALEVVDVVKKELGASFLVESLDLSTFDDASLGRRMMELRGCIQDKKITVKLLPEDYVQRLKDLQKLLPLVVSKDVQELDFRCRSIAILK